VVSFILVYDERFTLQCCYIALLSSAKINVFENTAV